MRSFSCRNCKNWPTGLRSASCPDIAPRFPIPQALRAKDILDLATKNNVRFLRLQFTDILGINKNVEIPASQFEKALAGDIMFDGSSIEGFVRIEESDMLLAPDFGTFQIFPWGDEKQPRRQADLRHQHSRRRAVCRRSARRPQENDRATRPSSATR